MKLNALEKRLDRLESDPGDCPHCRALHNLTDEELDEQIKGTATEELPDPSPTCPICREIENMSDEELDAEVARLEADLARLEVLEAEMKAGESRS